MSLNGGGAVTLGFTLDADDMMSGVLDRANAAVSRIHEGIVQLGAASDAVSAKLAGVGMAVFKAGRGFLEGAFDMAKAGAPFEAAMHDVARKSKASEDQLLDMNEAVFSAQNALMGFSALDSARALKELAQETGNAQMSLDMLEPALLLAGITERDAGQGAKQLGVAMRSFHIEAKDAGEMVDRLAVSSTLFHVKAGEMQDSLGRVARGAQLVGATMTDAAITLGLMRSGLPTLGQAAMAANMAFMRMGDAKVSAALKKIGVDTKDAHGALLPLPNVLGQLAEKTAKMTDAERAGALGKAFGARSAGAMTAAIKELQKGMTDSTGAVHKGADAVKYLYEQMHNSAGAARRSRDAMLDTFDGQNKVMKAAVESIKTGLSAPLASALKPVVGAVADGVAHVVEFFGRVDPASKKFIAQAVLLAGVLVTVLGAAFVFLGGPATLGVLALIAVGGALFEAYRSNLGGFADWVHDTFARVTLAFRALTSLFSKGGMSLDLFEELSADPSLMNFALNVYVWVNRAKAWFSGLADGFAAGVARIQPTFDKFAVALGRLAEKFGFVTGAVDPLANGAALTGAEANGRNLGEQLAQLADVVVSLATKAVDFIGSMVDLAKQLGLTEDPLGKLQVAFYAIAALKFAQMASGIASFGSSLMSANPYVVAITVAILALAAAWKTFHDLEEKYGEGKGMKAWWMNAKHNIGLTSDADYWKERNAMGGKGDAASTPGTYEYAHRNEQAYGGAGVLGMDLPGTPMVAEPAPMLASVPEATSSAAAEAAAAEGQAGAGGAEALHSAAEAVRDASSRTIQVNVPVMVMTPDEQVLASLVADVKVSSDDRAGVPQAPPS